MNDSVEDESLDQVAQLKAELEEMQERVDALEEENKALSDQVVSFTVIAFILFITDQTHPNRNHWWFTLGLLEWTRVNPK